MRINLQTGLFTAAITLVSTLSAIAPAQAFAWSGWTQSAPTVKSKAETGFDDTPFQAYVRQERLSFGEDEASLLRIDPTKLRLRFDHNVNVFFINEGAGYRNQLAFEATGTTNAKGVVFNDVACTGPGCVGDWGGSTLALGDGVNLGSLTAGTQLDFWLRADGLNRGDSANIFGTQPTSNPDGLDHAVAYGYGRYLLIGFEDLYGERWATGEDPETGKWNENSDRDFNDVVFVVDVGEGNVRHMASVPEPSTVLVLMGLGAAGVFKLRRRRQQPST